MLSWTAHPARRRPDHIALIAAVVLLAAWAVLVTLGSAYLALLAAVVLIASTASFLFPTHYRLDDAGVEQRRLFGRRFRTWSDLRRVEIGARAALVSPFARPTWMDRYRGFTLYFDGLEPASRARVIEMLHARIRFP